MSNVLTDQEFSKVASELTWTYAKTMPDNPHEYIVRGKTADEITYVKMFQTIEARGVWKTWKEVAYKYLHPGDGYYYWIMTDDIQESIIINRAEAKTE